jgi:hypothetical protein
MRRTIPKKLIHVLVPVELADRLDGWLVRTERTAHGARTAEITRMIEEGLARREKRDAK